MTPVALFSLANSLALAGWVALLAFPRQRLLHWWLAGIGLPGLLLFLALRAARR